MSAIFKSMTGMNNVVSATALPEGAVLEAVNGVFTNSGTWMPRDGASLVAGRYRDLWSHPALGAFGVSDGHLCQLHFDGATITTTAITPIIGDKPMSYAVLGDSLVWTNRNGIGRVKDGVAIPLGGEVPDTPTLTAHNADAPTLDSLTNEFGQANMPAGDMVRFWHGRLFVVRDNVLYFSNPMYYGVYSPSEGFIQFERRIDLFEPVESAAFIGDSAGVRAIKGDSPKEWGLGDSDGVAPQRLSGVVLPLTEIGLGKDVTQQDSVAAVWFTSRGFAVGLPDGRIVRPQEKAIEVAIAERGSTYFHDGHVISLQQ